MNKTIMGIGLCFIVFLIFIVTQDKKNISNQPDTSKVASNEQNMELENDPKQEVGFDINQVGKPFPELEENLLNVLKGNKEGSIFSIKTEGMLNGVSIQEDGTVIVDFNDFRNVIPSPTSAEKGQLGRELQSAVFHYEEVSKVYFQFEGSASAWWSWLEAYPQPTSRASWGGK